MLFLLGRSDKKARKPEPRRPENHERVRELFAHGKFPVVTTDFMEGKNISKVLGLVCCRGYDSEEAFFGMAAMAVNKGAHAIVGYCENVAFHPDGSKYFSCFGTAVMFEWDQEERYGAAALREPVQMIPRSSESQLPHASRAGASSEPDERALAARMADASAASATDLDRAVGMATRRGGSAERPSRLSARVDDDLGLPPLRPVGHNPSWNRT